MLHQITSKKVLARFFRRDPVLYIYALADLEDNLFNDCKFFGDAESPDELRVVLFIFVGMVVPCIVAHAPGEEAVGQRMLSEICRRYPGEFYGLIQENLVPGLLPTHEIYRSCCEQRMYLTGRDRIPHFECGIQPELLTMEHLGPVFELISLSTPETWFEESTLLYRQSWGVFVEGKLAAMTGTHVFSEQFGVAAIGNVITDPGFRGRGFATALVAHQCRNFPASISTIGLNVRADNMPAVRSYQKVGFQLHSEFLEVFAR